MPEHRKIKTMRDNVPTHKGSERVIRVAVIGAGGMSGRMLMQLLRRHPHVELGALSSERYRGRLVGEVFSEFGETLQQRFVAHEDALEDHDAAFLAVPDQASLALAGPLVERGVRVIDLSGAFRLPDPALFARVYGMPHSASALLPKAVYGLPEIFRERIRSAQLVANPGCYPSAALLGLLPLGPQLRDLIVPPVVDAKSGVSGAGGRTEDDSTQFMSVQENFRAYKVLRHRHAPEIACWLEHYTHCGPLAQVLFTPHLLPVRRGILSTMYLRFAKSPDAQKLRARFARWAAAEPFVRLLPAESEAELRLVQGTNDCVIALHPSENGLDWVVVSVIDNLLKGAAGQAVQNLNLMFGWPETLALPMAQSTAPSGM